MRCLKHIGLWCNLNTFEPKRDADVISELPRAGISEALISIFRNIFTFSGRARRSEYWSIIFFIPVFIGLFFIPYIGQIFPLLFFILSLSVTTRRLHDIGQSGWWVLLFTLVPFVALSVFFVSVGISSSIIPTEAISESEEQHKLVEDFFFVVSLMAISIIPVVGIIGLVWFTSKGDDGDNIYGPDPRQSVIK